MRERLTFTRGHQGRVWLHRCRERHIMHCHEALEINLAVRGRAVYLVKNQRYDLTAGTLLWLFPDQEHLLIEQSPDFEMWILVFRRPFVRTTCTQQAAVLYQRDPAGSFCVQLDEDALRHLTALYAGLESDSEDPATLNTGLAYALHQSLRHHHNARQRIPVRKVHPAVEQAARLLHQDPSSQKLSQVAHHVGLSPSRLSRLFKQQMGLTLISYRQRRCLELFLELVQRSPERKLMSLALQAGFGSYPQFHRIFTREMGQPPAQFIRRPAAPAPDRDASPSSSAP